MPGMAQKRRNFQVRGLCSSRNISVIKKEYGDGFMVKPGGCASGCFRRGKRYAGDPIAGFFLVCCSYACQSAHPVIPGYSGDEDGRVLVFNRSFWCVAGMEEPSPDIPDRVLPGVVCPKPQGTVPGFTGNALPVCTALAGCTTRPIMSRSSAVPIRIFPVSIVRISIPSVHGSVTRRIYGYHLIS